MDHVRLNWTVPVNVTVTRAHDTSFPFYKRLIYFRVGVSCDVKRTSGLIVVDQVTLASTSPAHLLLSMQLNFALIIPVGPHRFVQVRNLLYSKMFKQPQRCQTWSRIYPQAVLSWREVLLALLRAVARPMKSARVTQTGSFIVFFTTQCELCCSVAEAGGSVWGGAYLCRAGYNVTRCPPPAQLVR